MRLTGLIPPIVTPLRDGRIDEDSIERVINYLAPSVAGFLVGGSVGEHPSLSLEERLAVVRAVARCKSADHSLVANVSDNCIGTSLRIAAEAEEVGADMLIVSAPNYYTNTMPMVTAFLSALAENTSRDLCLYDNPIATHTAFTGHDLAELAAAVPRLTHIKVTDLAPDKVAWLREHTALTVLAGDDAGLWRMLIRGAHGAMVGLPMIYPEESRTMWTALQNGQQEEAAQIYRGCANFLHVALGAADYVQVIKTVLHARGVIRSTETRLPLSALDELRRAEVLAAL